MEHGLGCIPTVEPVTGFDLNNRFLWQPQTSGSQFLDQRVASPNIVIQFFVAADPGEVAMAEVKQMIHEQSEGLRLVGHDGVAPAGISDGNSHCIGLNGFQRFQEILVHLPENGDAEQAQAFQFLAQVSNSEVILSA
jgi:hypothetical protein